MNTIRLQFSSGRGPAECRMAVDGIVSVFQHQAEAAAFSFTTIDEQPGEHGHLSMIVSITGENAETFAAGWIGSLAWICPSPLRGKDSRKRWFIHCTKVPDIATISQAIRPSDCKWTTMRSSGAGGQHVNKTESAVRLEHIPSGIVTESEQERSQHRNKAIALEKLAVTLALQQQEHQAKGQADAWAEHNSLERGNPVRTFKGPKFTPA